MILLKQRGDENDMAEEIYMKYERDLTFLGVAGIEDVLRTNVPKTLQMMTQAGIRVWICSGDKFETTKSIAQLCKLFD